MKVILLLGVFWALCASAQANKVAVPLFDMDKELSPEDWLKLKELVEKEKKLHDATKLKSVHIEVLLNEYVDKLLGNIGNLIIEKNLDPCPLPDQTIYITIGHTTLTEGQLNDTSTIERYQNATLTYDNDSKMLTAEMVLRFEDLKFLFKYYTQVTLIRMTGHLHGTIQHIHIHVKLRFDFAQTLLFVDSIDFKHTGNIKVWVSGNALIDWIVNAMTSVITGILHNLILDIVKNIVAQPIHALVDAVNQALHPSTLF